MRLAPLTKRFFWMALRPSSLVWIVCFGAGLALLVTVVVAGSPMPKISPLHSASVTIFIGKVDSRSFARATVVKIPETANFHSTCTGMTGGNPGQISDVRWEFMGSSGGSDHYRFTRRFPTEGSSQTTSVKTISFDGHRVVVFEDQHQVVVMEDAVD